MAATRGDTTASVMERLVKEPWKFDFFALVTWLDRLRRADRPELPAIGTAPIPQREFLRFHSEQQQAFAPSDISRIEPRDTGSPESGWNVYVNMMGLTGPNGVLPGPYQQLAYEHFEAAESMFSGNGSAASALLDFYNLFDHRQISLFYRTWAKYRLPALYLRSREPHNDYPEDPITAVLYSLIGFASGPRGKRQAQRRRNLFPDEIVLYYAGLFSHWPRTAISLQNVVAEYFRLPVEVLEFQPQWVVLDPEDQSCLPSPAMPEGRNADLGQTVMIGSKICLYGSRFRLRIGPLSRADFDSLLPESPKFRELVQFVTLYVGRELTFDIQLVLKAAEVPACVLGGSQGPSTQLSRNSWLLARPANQDRDDVVLMWNATARAAASLGA